VARAQGLPYKAPCSAVALLGHRVLRVGRQEPAGTRAEGAGPAGRGRGALRAAATARGDVAASAPGLHLLLWAGERGGVRGVQGPGQRPPQLRTSPLRAHLSRPARPLPARARPTQLATRAAQVAESPTRWRRGPGCDWAAAWVAVVVIGGCERGRRCIQEGWWPGWCVRAGVVPWWQVWWGRGPGPVDGSGPRGASVGVHRAFWKAADPAGLDGWRQRGSVLVAVGVLE
jgi:hypothetical protein